MTSPLRKRIDMLLRKLADRPEKHGWPGYPKDSADADNPDSDGYRKADAWSLKTHGRNFAELYRETEQWLENEFWDLD
ncbi:hypothetical protein [Serratia ureilytica]|uniref:hypothetical protein n=1 Tax=Serratia ureilytica TaxID=300181 RepID=UPI001D17F945|nr:hypothetical protein [Serratia ureilytica]MCC4107087.1 hypothetical protein [Serratia ureilytica]